MTTALREGWRYNQPGNYWFRDLPYEDFESLEVQVNKQGGYDDSI